MCMYIEWLSVLHGGKGGWQQIFRQQIWKIFHILLYTGKHWQLYGQLRPSSQKQKIAIILDFLKDFSDIYISVAM